METYQVEVTRDGHWWMIYVPEIDQLTQARWPWRIKYMARDLIAVTLDVPTSEVAVELHFKEAA